MFGLFLGFCFWGLALYRVHLFRFGNNAPPFDFGDLHCTRCVLDLGELYYLRCFFDFWGCTRHKVCSPFWGFALHKECHRFGDRHDTRCVIDLGDLLYTRSVFYFEDLHYTRSVLYFGDVHGTRCVPNCLGAGMGYDFMLGYMCLLIFPAYPLMLAFSFIYGSVVYDTGYL